MKNFYPVLNELPISCKYVEQRAKTRLGEKIKTESINSRISKISLLKSHSIAIEGWRIIERTKGRERGESRERGVVLIQGHLFLRSSRRRTY